MNKVKNILNLDRKIVGVNARNRVFVYPNNNKKDFLFANDKAITKLFLEKYNIPHPHSFAVIENIGDINNTWEKLSNYDQLVIKPAKGKGGGGIMLLNRENETAWKTPSGKRITNREIRASIANIIFGIHSFGTQDRAIIEYQINSHQFFRNIYPDGVPDIRLLSYKRKIINVMLRIPTDKSDGKANLHQGAIGVSVDLKDGTLKQAYNYKRYLSYHPDSKVKIEGLIVPFWDEILEMAKIIAENSPLLFLGIDIAIDQEKGPLVLEINARPGIEIQNVTKKGLLETLSEFNF